MFLSKDYLLVLKRSKDYLLALKRSKDYLLALLYLENFNFHHQTKIHIKSLV
jgi:hypothetical protein